jgi:integrase
VVRFQDETSYASPFDPTCPIAEDFCVRVATAKHILDRLTQSLLGRCRGGYAADEDVRLMLLFAASTGARAGEQWAARWRDIDLENGKLHIARRVDAYGEEGAPKSAAGVRTVPISNQLTAMLKTWKMKSKFKRPDDLIFPNNKGNHVGHDNLVKRHFLPLFDKLEAAYKDNPTNFSPPPRRFNWHALRHFAVSCWIEAGMTPKTVQTFAGHASLQVTMDRYGHLFPSEDHKKVMDQIAKGLFA